MEGGALWHVDEVRVHVVHCDIQWDELALIPLWRDTASLQRVHGLLAPVIVSQYERSVHCVGSLHLFDALCVAQAVGAVPASLCHVLGDGEHALLEGRACQFRDPEHLLEQHAARCHGRIAAGPDPPLEAVYVVGHGTLEFIGDANADVLRFQP